MPTTDATLVHRVRSGDGEAFGELYDRRAGLIRAVCFDATGDLDAAADLTQEVFLRAYERLGMLRTPDRFSAWLVGVARQVCREWRRGRLRDRRGAAKHCRSVHGDMTGGGDRQPGGRVEALRAAIRSLPEKERLALHAFYLLGQNADEARSVVGLSRSGLYRVLSCARQRLARLMSREEVAP
ncbi:MAG: sigma-70 family RNA polymerase sigma factor [Phycisphaerae bacterium]